MNDIAFALGSFTGGLIVCVISWKFGAWLAGTMTRNAAAAAFLGAVLAFWYANTRDDTAAIVYRGDETRRPAEVRWP